MIVSNLPPPGVSLPKSRIGRPTDGKLVEQSLAGQRQAFDELIRRYQRQAVAVSYRLLGNTQDAMDITQEAFLKAFANLATLQKPEAFGGWLMRIVSNLSLNFRRGRKLRTQLSLDGLIDGNDGTTTDRRADPVHQIQSGEMGERLQEALRQLTEKQRTAIILFTIEQMPQKQVAGTLGCSVEAVKWHVFQGRKRLKEILKDHL